MQGTGRHAYMIVAHNQFPLLQKLLKLLDDPRNDIFVHVDKKATVDLDALRGAVRVSKLTFVKRISVHWGRFSMIRCELSLMREAAKGEYRYYHLLSGSDLPLRTQDEIHAFFEEHDGTEFLSVGSPDLPKNKSRIQYYYALHEWIGRRGDGTSRGLRFINRFFIGAQQLLRIDRTRKLPVAVYKGTNWFSITDGLVRHVLSREAFIRKHFNMSWCADELFVQTVAMDSPFRDRIDSDVRRFMIWQKLGPRALRLADYDAMRESGALWARKFDEKLDPEIVDRLFSELRPI